MDLVKNAPLFGAFRAGAPKKATAAKTFINEKKKRPKRREVKGGDGEGTKRLFYFSISRN